MADLIIGVFKVVVEYTAAPIGRQLGYLFCLNANVSNLKAELKTLNDAKDEVLVRVDLALRNVETISPVVETWLSDIGKISDEAQLIANNMAEFPKGCLNRWCLNLKSRHTLSRNAKKKAEDIINLQQKKPKHISFPSPFIPPVPSASATMDIGTRKEIFDEIINKLKDEKINMIGICGMGGIGKTTMAELVVKRVMEDKLFDEWAKTTVGQNPDYRRIQKDIAEMLGLKLHEENSEVRQGRLRQRLNNKKVLIWLDDVWEEFDLRNLGITFQDPQLGIIVLFTSRGQGFWGSSKTKIEFPLQVLSYEEAWVMFEAKVVDTLEINSDLKPMAIEIVKKCEGLPLALVVLGGALVGRKKSEWKDALRQLKSGYRTNIPGVSSNVHKSLLLSYNFLKDKDAQSLFLLCCLYEKGSNIPIEELVRMALGLRFLEEISGLEDTECRVFALIEQLKRCSLLLSSEDIHQPDKRHIKMHDVVRDVAKSIAEEKKVALVVDNSTKFVMLKNFRWISIISKEIRKRPVVLSSGINLLRCSTTDLQMFDSFHQEMGELQVLDLNGSESLTLLSSLQFPSSLRTLIFREPNLSSTTVIGDLPNLESLSFLDLHMKELPIEIGHMANLVSLDLSKCYSLTKIRHGVISNLCKLKELYMAERSFDWDGEGNASLEEFKSLSNLHTLHIVIEDPRVLPSSPVFSNLKKYAIEIGKENDFVFSDTWEKCCSISLYSFVPLEGDIKFLSVNAEELYLEGEFTKGLVHNSVQYGSQTLKILHLLYIKTLKYLTNAATPLLLYNLESLNLDTLRNLQQISCNPLMVGSFVNLKQLAVDRCDKLKNIFGLSVVRELVHLESLRFTFCNGMEEVIWKEGEEDASNKLAFPKLKRLELDGMKKLKSFCRGIDEIEFPQLNSLHLKRISEAEYLWSGSSNSSIFPEKVSFPKLQNLYLDSMKNIKDIWGSQIRSGSFCNLEHLSINRVAKLRFVFTPAIARYLVHLRELSIKDCPLLEVVIAKEKEEGEEDASNKLAFPKLESLTLTGLDRLKSFCRGIDKIEFPQLNELSLYCIPEAEYLCSGSSNSSIFPEKVSFPKLQNLYLDSMKNIKDIWGSQIRSGSFCNLEHLSINRVAKLRFVFTPAIARYLVHLRELSIKDCPLLEVVIAKEKEEGEEDASNKLAFPKLESLTLTGLDRLKSFCRGIDKIEFPQLNELSLYCIPEAEYLCSGSSNSSIFPEKVSFPKLQNLDLGSMKNIKDIWGSQIQRGFFRNLERLTVSDCENLSFVFTHAIARYLVHLRELSIRGCPLLEVVIAKEKVEGEEDASNKLAFPKLERLELGRQDMLKSFCRGIGEIEFPQLNYLWLKDIPEAEYLCSGSSNSSIFPEKVSFPKLQNLDLGSMKNIKDIWGSQIQRGFFRNLERLTVSDCENLSFVFTPAIARYLVHLRELSIKDCPLLEVVIAKEKEEGEEDASNKLAFPKLESLTLTGLDRLKSFCRGIDKIEFPQLNELSLYCIPEAEYLCSGSSNLSFFPEKVSFPNLQKLELTSMNNIKDIWGSQIQRGFFRNLERLTVSDCENLSFVFTPAIARYLVHLREISIRGCPLLEVVIAKEKVEGEEDASNKLAFPKLERLELGRLDMLKSFCRGIDEIEFPQLNYLWLKDIPEAEYLCSGSSNSSIFPEKVSFPNLHKLELTSMNNIKDIWGSQIWSRSFCNLERLMVSYCDKLSFVFTPAIARYLVHLRKLSIESCRLLEVVIAEEKEEGEEDASKLAFPKLERLELDGLYRLKSFCRGINEIEFPQLNSLHLKRIPEAEYLCSGSSNSSIFPEKVSFPKLRTLHLESMKNIKDIWGSQFQSGSFRNLKWLGVRSCHKLSFVFTPAIARYLVHLRELSIRGCPLLEVVIAKEKEEVKDTTLFPELNSVILDKLPALVSFCYVEHELEFRVLKEVSVFECPKLKTFSLAHVLTPDLDYVTISDWNAKKKETVWADDLNSTIKQLHEHSNLYIYSHFRLL